MKNILSSKEWIGFIGKERLQTFQDSFTRLHGISMCFLDFEGKPLTVWSNSSLFCHSMMKRNKTRCLFEKMKALEYVKCENKIKKFTCYLGLRSFMFPVYYNHQMVAIVYGGCVVDEAAKSFGEMQEMYHMPVLSDKKLMLIEKLLLDTLKLLDLDISLLEEFESQEDCSAQTVFFEAKLSKRETEVGKLICKGLSNREIAGKLFISEKTVKTHVSNILLKLELKDRTQLIVDYYNLG